MFGFIFLLLIKLKVILVGFFVGLYLFDELYVVSIVKVNSIYSILFMVIVLVVFCEFCDCRFV